MKIIIGLGIATIISLWLIYEAGWYGKEKLLISTIIGSAILIHIIINLNSTPIESYGNNTFLGATPSGILFETVPGIIFWGILSVFRIIQTLTRDKRRH